MMHNTLTRFDLLDACSLPGCPVCRLEQQSVERFLDRLFYEYINDDILRAHLRDSLGFCREHTSLLLGTRLSDALGMSIVYQDVVETAMRRLSRVNPLPDRSSFLGRLSGRLSSELAAVLKRVARAASPQKNCLACQQREQTTRLVLSVFADEIQEDGLLTAFTQSDGLCLPHLRQACDYVANVETLAKILQVEAEMLKIHHAHMEDFIHKSDYRFMKDGFGLEARAWRRAAEMSAGSTSSPDKVLPS